MIGYKIFGSIANLLLPSRAAPGFTSNKESARWQSHRFFLNFVKLKFPYVVKKSDKGIWPTIQKHSRKLR